jgi:hypothetical protein
MIVDRLKQGENVLKLSASMYGALVGVVLDHVCFLQLRQVNVVELDTSMFHRTVTVWLERIRPSKVLCELVDSRPVRGVSHPAEDLSSLLVGQQL